MTHSPKSASVSGGAKSQNHTYTRSTPRSASDPKYSTSSGAVPTTGMSPNRRRAVAAISSRCASEGTYATWTCSEQRAPPGAAHLVELVDDANVDVPPVGVRRDEFHRPLAGAADDDRDGAERAGLLLRLAQREVLALVIEGLAGPEGFHDLERLLEPFHPDSWLQSSRRRRSRARGPPSPSRCPARTDPGRRGRGRPPRAPAPPGAGTNRTARGSPPSTARSGAASQVLVTMASNIGDDSAKGGARWSMPATPPNPASSADRARSTSWSMLRRICGRNTQNSRGAAMGPRDYGQSAAGPGPATRRSSSGWPSSSELLAWP